MQMDNEIEETTAESMQSAQDLIDLIDKRIKQYHDNKTTHPFPVQYVATVDSINESDLTVNIIRQGSNVVLHNYPNKSCCTLEIGDVVVVENAANNDSNAVIKYKLQAEPLKIGYKGAYIDYLSGFTCTSDDGSLKVVMNADDCLAIQVRQSDGSYKTIQNLTTQGLGATRVFTLDDPNTYAIIGWNDGTGGLHLFCNNTEFCSIISLVGGGFVISNKDRTCLYTDNDQSTIRWNNSDNSKSAQVQTDIDGVKCFKDQKMRSFTDENGLHLVNDDGYYHSLNIDNNKNFTVDGTPTWSGSSIGGSVKFEFSNGMLTNVSDAFNTWSGTLTISGVQLHFTNGQLTGIN